jgi:peptidoglycan/xylan/chitin deacetylase (PgdA/CDA1 family)
MEEMADLEEKYGFRSSWNVPLAQYEFDWAPFERLRERGFEVGAHGLSHDGRLFRSKADFRKLRPKLEALARARGLRGFRSPSTLRRLDWMATMDFDYDSSFADTDVYEAQPGGTCSLFPFFIGRMVELPYTLAQDHTLINLLQCDPTKVWSRKIEWIAAAGGMMLALVHPDYIWDAQHRWAYEELLKRLSDLRSAWHALPSEVAAWWRRRAGLSLVTRNNRLEITGGDSTDAMVKPVSSEPLLRGESSWRAL